MWFLLSLYLLRTSSAAVNPPLFFPLGENITCDDDNLADAIENRHWVKVMQLVEFCEPFNAFIDGSQEADPNFKKLLTAIIQDNDLTFKSIPYQALRHLFFNVNKKITNNAMEPILRVLSGLCDDACKGSMDGSKLMPFDFVLLAAARFLTKMKVADIRSMITPVDSDIIFWEFRKVQIFIQRLVFAYDKDGAFDGLRLVGELKKILNTKESQAVALEDLRADIEDDVVWLTNHRFDEQSFTALMIFLAKEEKYDGLPFRFYSKDIVESPAKVFAVLADFLLDPKIKETVAVGPLGDLPVTLLANRQKLLKQFCEEIKREDRHVLLLSMAHFRDPQRARVAQQQIIKHCELEPIETVPSTESFEGLQTVPYGFMLSKNYITAQHYYIPLADIKEESTKNDEIKRIVEELGKMEEDEKQKVLLELLKLPDKIPLSMIDLIGAINMMPLLKTKVTFRKFLLNAMRVNAASVYQAFTDEQRKTLFPGLMEQWLRDAIADPTNVEELLKIGKVLLNEKKYWPIFADYEEGKKMIDFGSTCRGLVNFKDAHPEMENKLGDFKDQLLNFIEKNNDLTADMSDAVFSDLLLSLKLKAAENAQSKIRGAETAGRMLQQATQRLCELRGIQGAFDIYFFMDAEQKKQLLPAICYNNRCKVSSEKEEKPLMNREDVVNAVREKPRLDAIDGYIRFYIQFNVEKIDQLSQLFGQLNRLRDALSFDREHINGVIHDCMAEKFKEKWEQWIKK